MGNQSAPSKEAQFSKSEFEKRTWTGCPHPLPAGRPDQYPKIVYYTSVNPKICEVMPLLEGRPEAKKHCGAR